MTTNDDLINAAPVAYPGPIDDELVAAADRYAVACERFRNVAVFGSLFRMHDDEPEAANKRRERAIVDAVDEKRAAIANLIRIATRRRADQSAPTDTDIDRAYGQYDSDIRAHGVEDFSAFSDAIKAKIVAPSDPASLIDLQADINAWGAATFPDATLASVIAHFAEESDELRCAPSLDDLRTEIADCAILLMQIAGHAEIDLFEAIAEKMIVNRSRTWHPVDAGYSKHDDAGS